MTKEQKEREKMYDQYRKLGMTEEQISEIRRFDDEVEKGNKEYYEHTVSIEDL